jgi:MSHA biogenesis protein MshP
MKQHAPSQNGFAAITAIFLVLALATLGAAMVTFSNAQQLNAAQDYQGSRAYWAAKGGLEWAITGLVTAAPPVSALATCPTSTPPAVIDNFAVVITCTAQTYSEAGTDLTIFQLTSVASSLGTAVGGLGFVERSVSASLER